MKLNKKIASKHPKKLPRKSHLRPLKSSKSGLSHLGKDLQERRVALGITQRRFAELSGLQVATIGKIEKGDPGVKLATLATYLKLLNLTLYLTDASDDEEAP